MSAAESNVEPTVLRLSKGRHTWIFRYGAGEEGALRSAIAELAGRAETPFDWFDAALVTHQLTSRLKPGLDRVDGRGTEFADPSGAADGEAK